MSKNNTTRIHMVSSIDPRTLVELAQAGYQKPREILQRLPSVSTANIFDLSNLVKDYGAQKSPGGEINVDRQLLAKKASEFHDRAGTLTDGVRLSLEKFVSGAPILRVAHTPDHFAYLAVYLQLLYLSLVQERVRDSNLNVCLALLIVDWDVAGDKRLRKARIPDVERREGFLSLSSHVPKKDFGKVQYTINKPLIEEIDEWTRLLERFVDHNVALLYRNNISQICKGSIRERIRIIRQELLEAHARSRNLAEFNSIFMSRIINIYWKLPTIVWQMSKVSPLLTECYESLLPLYKDACHYSSEVVADIRKAGININENMVLSPNSFPFWYICQHCQERVFLRVISDYPLRVWGLCSRCGHEVDFSLGTLSNPDLSLVRNQIAPKVLFDSLTDIIGWSMYGGSSYIGSAEHIIINSLVALKLGFYVPPESLWRPRGIHFGLTELRAAYMLSKELNAKKLQKIDAALERVYFGRGSILYYILAQGLPGLYEQWIDHFVSGAQTFDVNIGKPTFNVPKNKFSLLVEKLASMDHLSASVVS